MASAVDYIEALEMSGKLQLSRLDWMIEWFKQKGCRIFLKPYPFHTYVLYRSIDNEDKKLFGEDGTNEIVMINMKRFKEV